jgi:nucleoside-diphosphate-sugar epimerase
MKVAVTGATGYIGEALLAAIAKKGYKSLALSRRPTLWADEWCEYDLFSSILSLPNDVSCVVHLAMNFEINSYSEQEKEIKAAIILAEAAKKVGAKFIYISSQTASLSAPTMYGKTKWEIENVVKAFNGVTIRPGLVYGGAPSGLFGQLTDLMRKSPFVPFFIPAPKVQPIHINDLCDAILQACKPNVQANTFCIASNNSIGFHQFLKLLSTYKLRRYSINIPIPKFFIDVAYKLLPNNIVLTKLHSLFNLPYMKTENDLSVLGLQLRDLRSGLHHSGSYRRRLLLAEGYALFTYLYREKSTLFKLRRYVKFIELNSTNEPLYFKRVICVYPNLIALIENNSNLKRKEWYQKFIYRLDVATALAEASPQGAKQFLRLDKKNSFLIAVLILSEVIFIELFFRLTSRLLSGLIKALVSEKVNQL